MGWMGFATLSNQKIIIMGILGLGKKNKTTVVEGVVGLVKNIRGMVDDSKFTDQEKSRFNMKMADAVADFAKATMGESTERSKARRNIAEVSIYFFYFLVIALIVLWKFDSAWFDAAVELIVSFQLPFAFIAIIGFFFGAHLMRERKPKS